jgi:hypothetical protein
MVHLFYSITCILVITAQFAAAKVSSGKALLNGEKSEALLTKFAISAGTKGSFDMKLTIPTEKGMYTDERFLRVHFFSNHAWTKNASKAPTCQEKVKYAAKFLPVEFNYSKEKDGKGVWLANVQTDDLGADPDTIRYWYITLDDCSLEISYHSEKDAPEIDYQYTIKNGDGNGGYTHFSADEIGMKKLHVIQILISSGLLICIALKLIKAIISGRHQVHIALIAVGCALSLDVLSCLSEMIHAGWYGMNGIGIYSFDCLATHLEAQCDAMIALVLILVGSGWTLPSDVIVRGSGKGQNMSMLGSTSIIQKLVVSLQSPSMTLHQLKNGNPASILLFSILISHAVLAQWGRTFDDEFDSFHALDHTAGKAVSIFRVVLGLLFLIGSASVRNSGRCPSSLHSFLMKFQMVGLSWFLSMPFVAMAASSSFPNYRKHLAMATGSAMVQACSLGSLTWLFCADESASAYHRLNTVTNNDKNMSLSDASSGGGGGRMWKIGKTKICLD